MNEQTLAEATAERAALRTDLVAVLNRHSVENFSQTPDYVLADYVLACLDTFSVGVRSRDTWRNYQP